MVDPLLLIHTIVVAVIGLCLGSFASALIYRIPRDIPWIYNARSGANKACRSACPHCGETLTPLDLIPLFSWLFSQGRCRHCRAPVSVRYPLIELATMLAVLVLFHVWGMAWSTVPLLLAVPFLVAALVIDCEHMILPDDCNLALTVLAVIFIGLRWQEDGATLVDPIIAACLLTGLLWAVSWAISTWKGRTALGAGDLKFLPAAGLFLGTAALPSFLALSGALGIATALLARKTQDKQAFPFGPAMIISLYIHVFLTGLGFDYTW